MLCIYRRNMHNAYPFISFHDFVAVPFSYEYRNLKICCKSSEELEDLHRFVKEIPGVSGTITHYVLKEVKNIYEVSPAVVDNGK